MLLFSHSTMRLPERAITDFAAPCPPAPPPFRLNERGEKGDKAQVLGHKRSEQGEMHTKAGNILGREAEEEEGERVEEKGKGGQAEPSPHNTERNVRVVMHCNQKNKGWELEGETKNLKRLDLTQHC